MASPKNNSSQPIGSFINWIGSTSSLIVHTFIFLGAFAIGIFRILDWDSVLLILTTAVSLEAIYMAIFIQMAVNRNTESLAEVEEDIDEIQEDIDEIQEGVDEIQEDVDEIQEDVGEITSDEEEEAIREQETEEALKRISNALEGLLQDIEKLKVQK